MCLIHKLSTLSYKIKLNHEPEKKKINQDALSGLIVSRKYI